MKHPIYLLWLVLVFFFAGQATIPNKIADSPKRDLSESDSVLSIADKIISKNKADQIYKDTKQKATEAVKGIRKESEDLKETVAVLENENTALENKNLFLSAEIQKKPTYSPPETVHTITYKIPDMSNCTLGHFAKGRCKVLTDSLLKN